MTDKDYGWILAMGGIGLLLITDRADWLPVLLPLAGLLAFGMQWLGRRGRA